SEEAGELVERRDLGRAGARERLRYRADLLVRHDAAQRADDALAILDDGLFRVNLHCRQPRDAVDRHHAVPDLLTEDLADVGCRIGADKQYPLAGIDKLQRGGAGDGRLANATLAGKEEVTRRVVQEGRDGHGIALS